MKKLPVITFILLFCYGSIFAQQTFEGIRITPEKAHHDKLKAHLKSYELYDLDVQKLSDLLSTNTSETKITLKLGAVFLDLNIVKNEIRTKNYKISYD